MASAEKSMMDIFRLHKKRTGCVTLDCNASRVEELSLDGESKQDQWREMQVCRLENLWKTHCVDVVNAAPRVREDPFSLPS